MSHHPTASSRAEVDSADVVALQMSIGGSVEVMRTWYRTQEFPRHTHEYFTLGLMLRGVGRLWLRGIDRTVRRGDVVIIAPGEVHTGGLNGEHDGVLSYLAVHVSNDVFAECLESRGLAAARAAGIRSSIVHDSVIAGALGRVDAAVAGYLEAGAAAEALANAIDCLVRDHGGFGRGTDDRVRRGEPLFVRVAREIIDDCYADNASTSLHALSLRAGVTSFHLVREFTRTVGLSPHRYVIQTRVDRARRLLADGIPSSMVAAMTGFVDQSHLITHFRKYVGTTPASYQRCLASRA